jgi:hypothetical protein
MKPEESSMSSLSALDSTITPSEELVASNTPGSDATRVEIKKEVLPANPLPIAPLALQHKHWYKNYKWWIGTAVIGTAVALDAHSSCRALGQPGMGETNLLVIGTPTCWKVSLVEVSAFSFYTAMHVLEYNVSRNDYTGYHGRFVETFGLMAIPAGIAVVHISAAVHNYEIPVPK